MMPIPTPIAKKLRVAPNDRFALFNAPPAYAQVTLTGSGKLDAVLIFVRMVHDLRAARDDARSVKPDGLIWIAYPKGGAMETDLNRDVLREAVAKHGLEGVSLVALDETWSAMRFKRAAKAR